MKVAIWTLGCRLNFAETEELAEWLSKKNYDISAERPQIVIIRGCSVTQRAERKTRAKINELRRKNKNALIVAAGCLGEKFFCSSADLIFLKEKEKNMLKMLEQLANLENKLPSVKTSPGKLPSFRTRAFIKIQDGCDNFCTYCIIPYLRGRERSRPADEIIKRIKEKEKNGYQEIVLTGVNICQWKDKGKDFIWLIKRILKETKIFRIRISSFWPNAINKKLIALFRNQRLCQHLHLSLQSLCQSVLKRMNRPYDIREIKKKIENLKKKFPNLTISADLIVGFPGETEKEFNETVKNVKKINLAKIHVFRYSTRQGTAAALMENQIDESIKKKRAKILISLGEQLNKKWREKFINQIRKVLFEQKKDNFWQGLTDNYLKVYLKTKRNLANKILSVKLLKIYRDGFIGKIH